MIERTIYDGIDSLTAEFARDFPQAEMVADYTKGRFIVSSVSSDAHMWNLVFLQLLLEEHGVKVVNLGACAPDEFIMTECRRVRPDVLVISTVNGHGHIDGLRLIKKIRQDPELAHLNVVIGGKLGIHGSRDMGFGTELIAGGFDAVFEADLGLQCFEEFLGTIAARPSPALAAVEHGDA